MSHVNDASGAQCQIINVLIDSIKVEKRPFAFGGCNELQLHDLMFTNSDFIMAQGFDACDYDGACALLLLISDEKTITIRDVYWENITLINQSNQTEFPLININDNSVAYLKNVTMKHIWQSDSGVLCMSYGIPRGTKHSNCRYTGE